MTPNPVTTLGADPLVPSGLRLLSLVTAGASAVTGGTLFAFSVLVMPALRRSPDGVAATAMQAINLQAPRSLLMLPLLGSAAGSAAVGAWCVLRDAGPHRGLLLVGAVTGLAAFAVTAAYHVPRNDTFAQLDPSAAAAAWTRYASGWTRWNHVRSVAALASAAAMTGAVLRGR